MTRSNTRIALALTGVLATLLASNLPLQSAFGEGGARRDVVRQEQQNVRDATDARDGSSGSWQTGSCR